jgi:hydrogenase expression/formation protein HypC
MCVAYPGKVLSIENNHARVDFTGSVVPVNVSMVSVQPGDYVLVHAGMAIQKVETEEAKEWIALFRDLEDVTADAAEEINAAAQKESKPAASSVSKTEDIHHA